MKYAVLSAFLCTTMKFIVNTANPVCLEVIFWEIRVQILMAAHLLQVD